VGKVVAPERLAPDHAVASFDCGIPVLDLWLKQRALKNEESGASRTYVIRADRRVIGYYALAAGSVLQAHAPTAVRRNMPDPIPVILLGRLAVDKAWQGKGLGRALLRDAILRSIHASEITGVRALIVYAISEEAKQFYIDTGFRESPVDSMLLMITIEAAKAALLA
jgi:GNAT superfamily N-acetyltransferase